MTKLPRDVKPQELIRKLNRLGFEKIAGKGSHIRLVHIDGRWTSVAVHPKPVPQGTLKAILRQANLTNTELLRLFKRR